MRDPVSFAQFRQILDDLSDQDCAFLAGMMEARGSITLGSASRPSGSTRWLPSVCIELRGEPAGHWETFPRLFGAPQERRYYALPSWRYVTQDKAKIAALLDTVHGYLRDRDVLLRASTMIEFCNASSSAERQECATRLRASAA